MTLGAYFGDAKLYSCEMIGEFDTHAFMRRLIQSTILRAATGGGRPPASEIILSVFGRFALWLLSAVTRDSRRSQKLTVKESTNMPRR